MTARTRTPIEERFWPKVKKTETCWIWTASKNALGYGRINAGGRHGPIVKAHRVAWEITVGPIPEGMSVDHMCHNPSCVNPSHLRLATHKQNLENFKSAFSTSASGIRGVSPAKRKGWWRVTVAHNYKQIHVGEFDDIRQAELAAIAARNRVFTHNIESQATSAAQFPLPDMEMIA